MSELRTDFKDEILQEGETHRVYNIKRKGTDEVVESEVYLEKAYESLQEGDEFGAKDVNEINGRLNGLAPTNLLINGDFQVNQRGQSEYISMLDSTVLTLDMWRVNANSNLKVNKLENGVKLTCTSVTANSLFYQQVDFELLGKTYTVQAKIDGVIYAHTFKNIQIENKHDLGNGVSLWVSSAEKYQIFGILFTQSKTINVEYLDVFEGDIAYPHVKEDYAIALMRCEEYVRKYNLVVIDYIFTSTDELFYAIPNGLGEDSTLDTSYIKNTAVLSKEMSNLGFAYNGVNSTRKDTMVIKMYKKNHGITSGPCPLVIEYIVTREPL